MSQREEIERAVDGVAGTTLTAIAFGIRVRLCASDRTALDAMTARLPPTWRLSDPGSCHRSYVLTREPETPDAAPAIHLCVDGDTLAYATALDSVLDVFALDVQMFVAEMAPGRVFVHAGSVGWRGRAIIVPGRSWSGKTTLVAALVRAGATYYSDEYAVLDDRGLVHPYAQALSVRLDPDKKPVRIAAESFGGFAGAAPLPIGLVVLSEYHPGAVWQPTRLSPGQAALALVGHTVSIRRQPVAALAALEKAVAQATVLQGERGDASPLVTSLLGDEPFADTIRT